MNIATTCISNQRLSSKCYLFVLCIIFSIFVSIPLIKAGPGFSNCPNSCSYQGMCSSQIDVNVKENRGKTNTTITTHRQSGSLGICNCFPGFHGVDCSIRLCPSSTAWVDFPSGNNIAHAPFTECSNMGLCNRTTGKCECNFGYYGPACDVMSCPFGQIPSSKVRGGDVIVRKPCSNNGVCMSVRNAAVYQDYEHLFNKTIYTDWDADKIHGCVCDEGYEGAACEKKSCPKGDDPLTPGIDEIHYIDCMCQHGYCEKEISLTFKGQSTIGFAPNSPEELVSYRLHQLTTIDKITVEVLQGNTFCSTVGSVTRISFRIPIGGPQPEIKILGNAPGVYYSSYSNGEASLRNRAYISQTSTRENVECSNHGVCDYSIGLCTCQAGYRGSDGATAIGDRGDCGHNFLDTFTYYRSDGSAFNTPCPVFNDAICSNHGICSQRGDCICDYGYGGPACTNLTCTSPVTWIGDTNLDHRVNAECSGVGTCNGITGICENCGGEWGQFTGDRCELLACPKINGTECGGNGRCITLQEMARFKYTAEKKLAGFTYTTPWDATMVKGCACLRSLSIDNTFKSNYSVPGTNYYFDNVTDYGIDYTEKFYRGPYAFASTDYTGFNCGNAACPTGDNPQTSYQVNEVQELRCRADNGTFQLTFRENSTNYMSWNVTAEELEYSLEQLYTIRDVNVYMEGNNGSVCSLYGNNKVFIEFVSEHGDVPLITANENKLQNIDSSLDGRVNVEIIELTKGTKEDVECSAQGICMENTGICACVDGFFSSNGDVKSSGETGDCTYKNPMATVQYDSNGRKKKHPSKIIQPVITSLRDNIQ